MLPFERAPPPTCARLARIMHARGISQRAPTFLRHTHMKIRDIMCACACQVFAVLADVCGWCSECSDRDKALAAAYASHIYHSARVVRTYTKGSLVVDVRAVVIMWYGDVHFKLAACGWPHESGRRGERHSRHPLFHPDFHVIVQYMREPGAARYILACVECANARRGRWFPCLCCRIVCDWRARVGSEGHRDSHCLALLLVALLLLVPLSLARCLSPCLSPW